MNIICLALLHEQPILGSLRLFGKVQQDGLFAILEISVNGSPTHQLVVNY